MVQTIQHTAVVDFAFDEEQVSAAEAARDVEATYDVRATLLEPCGNSWPQLRISGPRAHVKACLIKSWGLDPREADEEIHEEFVTLLVCGSCGRGSYATVEDDPVVYDCTNIQCGHSITEGDLELDEGERLELVTETTHTGLGGMRSVTFVCVAREDV